MIYLEKWYRVMLKEITNQQAKDLAKLEINRILVKAKYNGQNKTL